jgi:hypothetical protein
MTDDTATPPDISTMTPAEATAALVAKAAAYHAPRGPAPPAGTTIAAKAHLEALTSDPAWSAKFFAGDIEARKTFSELTAKIADGNPTADALAGAPTSEVEVTIGKELNSRNRADAIAGLRSLGMDDATVVQAIDGAEVGEHERTMAQMAKNLRLSDSAWTERYLKNDLSARREMTLINTILSSGT